MRILFQLQTPHLERTFFWVRSQQRCSNHIRFPWNIQSYQKHQMQIQTNRKLLHTLIHTVPDYRVSTHAHTNRTWPNLKYSSWCLRSHICSQLGITCSFPSYLIKYACLDKLLTDSYLLCCCILKNDKSLCVTVGKASYTFFGCSKLVKQCINPTTEKYATQQF